MNHSLKVVLEFVSDFFEMSIEDITSESQVQKVVKTRRMVILLASGNSDKRVAKFLGMSRPNVVNGRRAILNEMEINADLRKEFEKAKHDLLIYEIS